jgi:hypothetical protein
MAGESKLPDPFGRYQWVSPRRWLNGANLGRARRSLGSLSESVFRGEASHQARTEAARRAFASNQDAFGRVPALHHMAICGADDTASNLSGLGFIAYLRPGSREEDAAELPREIRARGVDGSDLGYSFPVRIEILPQDPIVFSFSGGDSVLGRLRGTCCFAFSQGGDNYFITNSHVICDPDQSPISKQCREPAGVCHDGIMLKSNAVNTLDVAVVRTSGVSISDMAIQGRSIRDREDPYERSPHGYFYVVGSTTISCTRPERVLGTVNVEHQGRFLRYAGFWTLTTSGALPARGQSGAALCREEGGGLLISGIVFGGIPGSNKVWVYSASDVWRALFK